MRGKQAGEEEVAIFSTEMQYSGAGWYMQVKFLRAVGCYTTLTLAFALSQGLGGQMGWKEKKGSLTNGGKRHTETLTIQTSNQFHEKYNTIFACHIQY